MNSCFFAGMADYSAHPLFTEDVEQRLTAIAASVVDSERQFELIPDFERSYNIELHTSKQTVLRAIRGLIQSQESLRAGRMGRTPSVLPLTGKS